MLLICSMGGCASTKIISWFSHRIDCNCPRNSEGLKAPGPGGNSLGLKHRICPPREDDIPSFDPIHGRSALNSDMRISKAIFIFDDPRRITLSLFRRTIAVGHSMAITGSRPAHKNDFHEFLRIGEDSFGFERQFENWTQASVSCPYPRLLIRGSCFWDQLPTILDFAEVPATAIEEFPQKRPRVDRYAALASNEKTRLDSIYRSLVVSVESSPSLLII